MTTSNLPPAQQRTVDSIKGGVIFWKHTNGDVAVKTGSTFYRVNKDGNITGISPPPEKPDKPEPRTPKPKEPLWLTPERKEKLIELFNTYGMPPQCLQGHPMCQDISHYITEEPHAVWVSHAIEKPVEDPSTGLPRLKDNGEPLTVTVYTEELVPTPKTRVLRLHDLKIEERILAFKQDDIDAWKALKKELHRSGETRGKPRGRWGSISREIRNADRPIYIRESIGLSATTFQPVAKVHIMWNNTTLWVELGPDIFKNLSKNAKRKALRYGRVLNKEVEEEISSIVSAAVREYL